MNTPSDLDPQTNLRTDLWPTMTLAELENQQSLLITKLSLLGSMMGGISATESLRTMYGALYSAQDDIRYLLEQAATQKPRKQ